jgi:hypothetical protein
VEHVDVFARPVVLLMFVFLFFFRFHHVSKYSLLPHPDEGIAKGQGGNNQNPHDE